MYETIPTIGIAMPTAADWGQFYAFGGSGDAGLIMPPRSYYFRDFLNGSWQNIVIGFLYSCTATTGTYDDVVAERQAESTFANLFQFGISQDSGGSMNIPSQYFMGLAGIIGGVTQIVPDASAPYLAQLQMTLVNNNATSANGSLISLGLNQGSGGTPFAMIGIRFIFNPINQTLSINFAQQTNIALADDTADVPTLQPFLQAISSDEVSPSAQFLLNNNSQFKNFFIYWPYILNQLKVHCVAAIQLN